MTLSFTVPGTPVPKGRARSVAWLQCQRCQRKTMQKECRCGSQDLKFLFATQYTPKDTMYYENAVAMMAKAAMNEAGILELISEPLAVDLTAYFDMPPSRACSGTRCKGSDCKRLHDGDWHAQKPDADNLQKSFCDGANKVVFADDSQIAQITARKFWSTLPRLEVQISILERKCIG